jgi:hypothetical protein
MGLYGAVDGKANHVVQKIVTDSTDDVRRSDYIPLSTSLLAVRVECVLLRVVEVGFECYSRIGLERWVRSRANVEAILLGTSLQEEALRLEASILETLCEVDDQVSW